MNRDVIIIIISVFCFGGGVKSTWSTGRVVEYLPGFNGPLPFHLETGSTWSTGRVVEYLPGFNGPLPFHLETGYVGVDKNEDVQLFYYFIQSKSNPDTDPIMLWLTGGPGCSSLSGLLYEIGPIQFEAVHYNGSLPKLILSPSSWTEVASIIFLDIPVGSGFSYSKSARVSGPTDIQYCDHAYEFVTKWFESHPKFISNPFYVGGDSYSGNPVPIITQLISNGNEVGKEPYINLKGYVLGNPLTFPYEENYKIRFANGMGLISDELYKSLFDSCRGEYRSDYISSNNTGCLQNLDLYQQCIDGIREAQILEPLCVDDFSPIKLPSQMPLTEQHSANSSYCRTDGYKLVNYWMADPSVREALHIREGTIGEWIRCNYDDLNFTRTFDDVRPYHLYLSNKGYRSLIYSGDHDMVIPHQSTQAWIKELNYYVIDQWRSWKLHGQIAGYTESYSNGMTYATVKAGGHTAPEYKPEECFFMFKRWIAHQSLTAYILSNSSYVGVDKNEDVQLFYYFIQSESNPDTDPIMLWLTGGPGCSSISGLLYEIGPIQFEAVHYNRSLPNLILNPNSWTKMASIIFLDIPFGTGFSYWSSAHVSGPTDIQYCDHAYEFVSKWFESHPEFISNPFYVGGDSYSGNPVPIITQLISNGNEAGKEPYINLKGYVLGNPLTSPYGVNYRVQFANGMGLISDELYKSLSHSCRGEYRSNYINPENVGCLQNLHLYQQCVDGIKKAHILEPLCVDHDSPIKLPSQTPLKEQHSSNSFYCRTDGYKLVNYWMADPSVREALHIREGTIGEWIRCNYDDLNFTRTLDDVRPYHLWLSDKGYRSLVYSGDHDMVIPHQSTEAWIKELNYSVIDQWRSWKLFGQIAGYTESYSNNMTYATVKGGGHTAPEYKPEECFAMFKRWIAYQSL
ncbi:uncharacterized protein [Rutidosis leptorrhynchoides]|uniref:uncharacterized protein n=1 Tax=Rutidosis leptorrhynchoides TaxID=125765 RepID=UPI003A9A0608